jgi:DnaJ like chaperone protein
MGMLKIFIIIIASWAGGLPFGIFAFLFITLLQQRWNSFIDYDVLRSRMSLENEYKRMNSKRARYKGQKTHMSGGTNYFYNMDQLNVEDYRYQYVTHLVRVAAAVISVDKDITKEEMRVINNFLINMGFSEDYLNRVKDEFEKALYEEIFIPMECEEIRKFTKKSERLEFVRLLFIVATSDRSLKKEEEYIIEEIAFDLYLNDEEFRSIRGEFRPKYNSDYEILGVSETAKIDQIKQAYKRLVKKNHPDKFAHLGKELVASATERLKRINAAYSKIKKERGF